MSGLDASGSRPSFASRTAFEALAIDSGEESEEEQVPIEPTALPTPENSSQPQAKLSKSAIKKAAKTARLEKKQQAKASKSAKRSSVSENSVASSEDSNPAETQSEVQSVSVTPAVRAQPLVHDVPLGFKERAPTPNGTVNETSSLISSPQPLAPETLGHSDPNRIGPTPHTAESSSVKPLTDVRVGQLGDVSARENLNSRETEQVKKRQNVLTRTLWTLIMISGFMGLLVLGHAYMVLLVMLCQTLVYREVTALFSLRSITSSYDAEHKKNKDPWKKTLNWYFFAVTNYFLYGESIIYYFKHVVFADAQWLPFATNHRMISFILYTMGFMGFVMSLKKGYLKQQFSLFGWVHMSLLLIVVSSHFVINNILEGLIWFWVPSSVVICNDVFAYIWGITLGRTPLIKLSPKKTVEGFVGAFWSTIVFGILWGTYFMRFKYMICPVHDLGVSAWSNVECEPNPIFVWKEWQIWTPVAVFLSTLLGRSVTTIPYAPYQFHLLFMSCFASLVAPFGGFFASGFKRAFDIKDFGTSIPGHGGMTDRMDCQFLMGVFTYVYYSSLIREHHVTVGSILQMIVSGLTVDEQLELIADLKRYLDGKGIFVP